MAVPSDCPCLAPIVTTLLVLGFIAMDRPDHHRRRFLRPRPGNRWRDLAAEVPAQQTRSNPMRRPQGVPVVPDRHAQPRHAASMPPPTSKHLHLEPALASSARPCAQRHQVLHPLVRDHAGAQSETRQAACSRPASASSIVIGPGWCMKLARSDSCILSGMSQLRRIPRHRLHGGTAHQSVLECAPQSGSARLHRERRDERAYPIKRASTDPVPKDSDGSIHHRRSDAQIQNHPAIGANAGDAQNMFAADRASRRAKCQKLKRSSGSMRCVESRT